MNRFKTFILAAFLISAVIAGCNKNDSITGPNASQVTFQISQQNGANGIEFLFNPSVDTKISKIVSRLQAQQFADTVTFGNPNYVFSKDTIYIVNEYVGVVTGQQWNFDFTGAIPNQNNSNYNSTANYTVQ